LPIVPIVNYHITYTANPRALGLKFPWMLWRVFMCAAQEHRQLDAIIREHRIAAVISDQRFGCHSSKAYSIYISHQLLLRMPLGFRWIEPLFWLGLRTAVQRYDRLWIPDYPAAPNLTGDLTRRFPLPRHHRFIGPLSRVAAQRPATEPGPDLLVLLSGPEPQRSILETIIMRQIAQYPGTVVVLLAKPGITHQRARPGERLTLLSHAPSDEIAALIQSARAIVCRGGYSTIMDLVSLGKKAVVIPTPGQTEQRYLCERLSRMGCFVLADQERFDLRKAMAQLERISGPTVFAAQPELFDDAIDAAVCDARIFQKACRGGYGSQ
jgi:uncharacterized protein (TIGR00661 family)